MTGTIRLWIRVLLILLLAPVAFAQNKKNPTGSHPGEEAMMRAVKVTRWADPHTRPDTYLDYLAARAGHGLDGPFSARMAYQSPAEVYASKQRVDLLLEAGLYKDLQADLTRHMYDLECEGWGVTLWLCEGGKPVEVRDFLINRWKTAKILGCTMIGDVPVAWFEMDDDWHNKHGEFPCDLFYMDMDGVFGDADNDGKFDSHVNGPVGTNQPDIILGRLRPSPLAGSWGTEADLLRNYFRKVHGYRWGTLSTPERALAFQDDDWSSMRTHQEQIYSTVVMVSDWSETTADNYQKRLAECYESVIVCAHSTAVSHTFKKPGSTGGSISNTTLWALDPPCLFYNLYACSSARFTYTGYIGGVYIFDKSMGLIAVGTTKTGGMLFFDQYYKPLAQQDTFGEAFRLWFARRYSYSSSSRRWYYGMTLLGDPTLRVERPSLTADFTSAGPGKGFTTNFLIDGCPDNAGQVYAVLVSMTGTTPGFTLTGVRVPLTPDLVTFGFLAVLNSPLFPDTYGTLDAVGQARAKFMYQGEIPAALLGKEMYFSAVVMNKSNAAFLLATPPATITLKE